MQLTDIEEQANEVGIDEVVIPNYNKIKDYTIERVNGEYIDQSRYVVFEHNTPGTYIVLLQEGCCYIGGEYEWQKPKVRRFDSFEQLVKSIDLPPEMIAEKLLGNESIYNMIAWKVMYE